MNRIFTLAIIFLATISLSGQTILTEDFSGNLVPPAGWTVSDQALNWKISNTANAGGTAPEGKLTWSPQFNTMTRLISPALDLSGNNTAIVSFRHMLDHYASNYQIGIATRASQTDDWTNVWTQTVNSNIPAQTKTVVIENEDVDSPTFQFCLFFNGNSYNMNDWYFDDFELIVPVDLDAAMGSVNVPAYFLDEQTVAGSIINNGLQNIHSYDINWSVDDGEVFTTSYTGLNLTTGTTHNFQSQHLLNPEPGIYSLKVWLSNVNGQGQDDNPDNDLIELTISIPYQTLQRRPLFEEFTSSTCGPCYTFNRNIFNPFIDQHGDEIGLIKYQMNWPGNGDPYYTAEGGIRRMYYGVNAVPMLYVEGKNVSTSASAVNNAFNTAMANPAFVKIEAAHVVDGDDFSVTAQITSYADLQNVILHVVFIEQVTTENVASNGETEFHHVMMKMMPDANGAAMNFTANETQTITYTYDMSTTNVEEMEDLIAVIFLQDNATKYVFQSAYSSDINTMPAIVSFDPTNGTIEFPTEADLHIQFSMPVYHVGGQEITNDNVAGLITLQEVDGDEFPFTATINEDKTIITVSPVGLLDKLTTYLFGINDVENEYGIITPGSSVTFTTGFHVGIQSQTATISSVIPNPAKDQITLNYHLSSSGPVFINLIDINGKEVMLLDSGSKPSGNQRIIRDLSSLPNGMYLIRLKTDQNVHTSKIVISR